MGFGELPGWKTESFQVPATVPGLTLHEDTVPSFRTLPDVSLHLAVDLYPLISFVINQ